MDQFGLAPGSGQKRMAMRRAWKSRKFERESTRPSLDAGRPHLEVVLARLHEAQIAGTHVQHPVGQAKRPAQDLGAFSQPSSASFDGSGRSKKTISTLSNWWTRIMPRRLAGRADLARQHGE